LDADRQSSHVTTVSCSAPDTICVNVNSNSKFEFDFRIGDIRNIPFEDAQIGVVTAIEVIEHINNPLTALLDLHRIRKDDSVFIVAAPNNNVLFSILWWVWKRTFCDEWKDDHLVTYNKKQWLDTLTSNNLFKVETVIDYWAINLIFKLRKL